MEYENLSKKKKEADFRTSVSAEVYGKFNKKGDFMPKVIHKPEEVKNRIKQRLM